VWLILLIILVLLILGAAPRVAVQSRLEILPERRPGPDFDHRTGSRTDAEHLTKGKGGAIS
jgi:hypothetical protein